MTHTSTFTAMDVAQAYLAAWNAQDSAAVTTTLAPDGSYLDPTLPAPIGGQALIGYVAALTSAFPDLRFEVEQVSADGHRVIVAWRMRGTNTGVLLGMPEPTARPATCRDRRHHRRRGRNRHCRRHFDQKTFVDQLGLQALVVPANEPPLLYGISARTDLDNTTVPGTVVHLEVQRRTSEVLQGLAAEHHLLRGPRGPARRAAP
jgi:steroid delta-isomerase-like uncharacterized protein